MQTNPNDFLKEQLELYKTNDSNLRAIEDHFRTLLAAWGKENVLAIKAIGSVAQGTSVKKEYDADLDISVSLRSDIAMSHQDIFDSLTKFLKMKKFAVEVRNISQRVVYKGVDVDLVPAIKFPGKTTNHYVWSNKRKRQEKSNVQKHINIVKESGLRDEIKLMKIWATKKGLKFPGFYLSLVVLEALKDKTPGNLADNVLTVLKYLESKFLHVKFLDPANSEDYISDDLDEPQKKAVVKSAKESLKQGSWNEIFNEE